MAAHFLTSFMYPAKRQLDSLREFDVRLSSLGLRVILCADLSSCELSSHIKNRVCRGVAQKGNVEM